MLMLSVVYAVKIQFIMLSVLASFIHLALSFLHFKSITYNPIKMIHLKTLLTTIYSSSVVIYSRKLFLMFTTKICNQWSRPEHAKRKKLVRFQHTASIV